MIDDKVKQIINENYPNLDVIKIKREESAIFIDCKLQPKKSLAVTARYFQFVFVFEGNGICLVTTERQLKDLAEMEEEK